MTVRGEPVHKHNLREGKLVQIDGKNIRAPLGRTKFGAWQKEPKRR